MLRDVVDDDMTRILRKLTGRHQPTAAEVRDDVLAALDEVEQAQGVGDDARVRDAEAALQRLLPFARQAGVLSPEPQRRPDFDAGVRSRPPVEASMNELLREAATGWAHRAPRGGRP